MDIDIAALLQGSDVMLIFLARQMLAQKPGAQIVFDVKCTQALIDEIEAAGGKPGRFLRPLDARSGQQRR